MVIAVGYKAQSGKDTTALRLSSKFGFKRFAFADPLKEALCKIFGFTMEQLSDPVFKNTVHPYWNDTPRHILQYIGTDCLRDGYRDDIWVKALEKRLFDTYIKEEYLPEKRNKFINHVTTESVIITDLRFLNEFEFIKSELRGICVKIDRPDAETNHTHASETELDQLDPKDWDYILENYGDLDDFTYNIDAMLYDLLANKY